MEIARQSPIMKAFDATTPIGRVNELKALLLETSEKMKTLKAEGINIEFAFQNGDLTMYRAFQEMKLSQ